ncbi:MAG TPA: alpha/beta hydrolase [Solirubrobacterales bacterium]
MTDQSARAGESKAPAGRPTLMLIHGSWHWSGCFVRLANELGAMGYPTVAPDLLSHGLSEAPFDSFETLEEYAAPAAELLESCRGPVVLVGHSMGGIATSYLAERNPEKVVAGVYVGAFLVPEHKTAADYITAHADHPIVRELFEVVSVVADGKGLEIDVEKAAQLRTAFYEDCDDAAIRHALAGLVRISSTVPDRARPTLSKDRFHRVPRLYIELARDRAIPLSTQRAMVSEFPGTDTVTLDAGHFALYSRPEELASAIDGWLARRGHALI